MIFIEETWKLSDLMVSKHSEDCYKRPQVHQIDLGSVMMWTCVAFSAPGQLIIIDRKQQYNNLKHEHKVTSEWQKKTN